jgi:hypothetical protein
MIRCRIIKRTIYVIVYDEGKYFSEPKTRPATQDEIKHIQERERKKKVMAILKEHKKEEV